MVLSQKYKFHSLRSSEFSKIFITCILLYQLAKSGCHSSEDSFAKTSNARYYSSINVLDVDSEKYKETDNIKKVHVQVIHRKVNDYIYNRLVQFQSFGRSFRILLRRHVLLDENVHLTVDDELLGIGALSLTTYLPVCYCGILEDNPNSLAHGKVTDTEFVIFLEHGNEIYSVECPFLEHKGAKTKYGTLTHSLNNCQAYNLFQLKTSKSIQIDDIFDSKSTGQEDFVETAMPVNEVTENPYLLKRAKRSSGFHINGSCIVRVTIDHHYIEHVGKGDVRKALSEMMTSFSGADSYFRQSDFNGDDVGDNFGLMIGNITIFRSNTTYNMKAATSSAYNYLNAFSKYDHSKYCVAVALTFQNFFPCVGLAWAGSPHSWQVGGVCQGRAWGNSYNTAIVTQLTGTHHLPSVRVGMCLAHEVGHSFGAGHDGGPICAPGGDDGNFLMSSYLTGGKKPNNKFFSNCSTEQMYPVIVKRGPGCIKEYTGTICGNGVIEGEEECDCGTVETCQDFDPCCAPVNITSADLPCKIKRLLGYQCSPLVSPCCSPTCHFYNATDQVICQEKTECSEKQFCEPGNGTCPEATPLPDDTPCNNGRQICSKGMCSLSICSKLNLTECECTTSLSDACHLCCKPPSANSSSCSPINTFSSTYQNILKHGDPCFNYKGFCDENGECILQQEEFVDSLNYLLSMKTLVNAKVWFKRYWYYVFAGILFITSLTVIITLYFKPLQDLKTDSIRTGKLSALFAQAEAQKQIYREKIKECDSVFKNFVQQANKQQCSMSLTRAVARLAMFFPTAPMMVLTNCVKSCSTEEFAVKMMLMRNFPMQTFTVTLDEDKISTNKKTNSSVGEAVV